MLWSRWITNAWPTVGLYIQCEAEHDLTGEVALQEGEVAGIEDSQVWFTHESGPQDTAHWTAFRWRYRRESLLNLSVFTKEPADALPS